MARKTPIMLLRRVGTTQFRQGKPPKVGFRGSAFRGTHSGFSRPSTRVVGWIELGGGWFCIPLGGRWEMTLFRNRGPPDRPNDYFLARRRVTFGSPQADDRPRKHNSGFVAFDFNFLIKTNAAYKARHVITFGPYKCACFHAVNIICSCPCGVHNNYERRPVAQLGFLMGGGGHYKKYQKSFFFPV